MSHKHSSAAKPASHRFGWLKVCTIIVAIAVGGWAGASGAALWQRAHAPAVPTSTITAASSSPRQAAEGTDTTPLPVDTLADYKVAGDMPRALYIDKLHIAARILPMGTNPDNSMQAPININDSGWYTGSAKPGAPGAMVIDGHSSATNSATHLGLFNALDSLTNGDIITVEKGDGTKLSYKVIYKETVALDAIDMAKALKPYGGAAEGLNLITCSGQWQQSGKTLDHRTIVYTERIST